jgi:hypothetical protein
MNEVRWGNSRAVSGGFRFGVVVLAKTHNLIFLNPKHVRPVVSIHTSSGFYLPPLMSQNDDRVSVPDEFLRPEFLRYLRLGESGEEISHLLASAPMSHERDHALWPWYEPIHIMAESFHKSRDVSVLEIQISFTDQLDVVV